ncbi:MAG: peptidylprolyl isomerase [Actinobacteria bacterium]|nr:peptidylprolyl isomerase [Actinomycetota bacterium]
MKRSAIALLVGVVLLGGTLTTVASAATKAPVKAAKIVCKATKAKGHTPKKVTPPAKMTPGKMGKFTLVTNCGNIVIQTNGVRAPVTLTALTALAKGGYFNGSLCHRLTTQGLYVLQCGDPTATGTGGPGFTYQDENLPAQVANNYPAGSVAMANSGPSTNGSQFFLVYANTTLGASYTIWGKITSGLDIVKAIAKAGVKGGGADGAPAKTVAIEKVIVS